MTEEIRRRRACARPARLALGLALALWLGGEASAAESPPLTGVVNVNTATVQELQLLPGIGESRALALVELRKRRGGFKSLEELKEVKGIGDASLSGAVTRSGKRRRPHRGDSRRRSAHREVADPHGDRDVLFAGEHVDVADADPKLERRPARDRDVPV